MLRLRKQNRHNFEDKWLFSRHFPYSYRQPKEYFSCDLERLRFVLLLHLERFYPKLIQIPNIPKRIRFCRTHLLDFIWHFRNISQKKLNSINSFPNIFQSKVFTLLEEMFVVPFLSKWFVSLNRRCCSDVSKCLLSLLFSISSSTEQLNIHSTQKKHSCYQTIISNVAISALITYHKNRFVLEHLASWSTTFTVQQINC